MSPILSVIYVYYNTPDELKSSIKSLKEAVKKSQYEIIIIDNKSPKKIPQEILRISGIKIIENSQNYGYGKGLNQGVKIALGKYVLLANTDTEFTENSISYLLDKLKNSPQAGAVAPKLIDRDEKTLQSISSMPYLPFALINFSFINKIWPNNPVATKYHNLDLDRNKEHNVDVVGGACMLVKKSVFNKVGGFDEKFFMYFEEADFCFRINKAGYRVVYYPKSKVVHLVGKSSQDKEWIESTFEQSRFEFFRKYHGLAPALFGEAILRFLKPVNLLLTAILFLSLFLNFYKLTERMIFIGDQGWFYLSARDMILSGKIPLVGITSSHTWLHQGPIWTYIVGLFFWLFNFNPIAPAYFSASLGVITVWFIYKVGKILFSKNLGLIAAGLYAASPLVVINTGMPYHTSPISFLSLLFIYSLYKWLKGNAYFFPILLLSLSLLYNFELATQVLWFIFLPILAYGIWRKTYWIRLVLNAKIITLSLFFFFVPMIPILIYDYAHRFLQTFGFIVWIGYKIFSSTSVFLKLPGSANGLSEMLKFYFLNYQRLALPYSTILASILLIFTLGSFLSKIYRQWRIRKMNLGYFLLASWVFLSTLAFLINKTPSEAYLPLLFPGVIILTALFLKRLMEFSFFKYPTLAVIIFIVLTNSYYTISQNYLIEKPSGTGLPFSKRLEASKLIVKAALGKRYNIVATGESVWFESSLMNYEYLMWWLGNEPSKKPERIKFVIEETQNKISVEKK